MAIRTLDNNVDPLDYRAPIVDRSGSPTPEFQRKWERQRATNATIPDATTAKAVSAIIDLISSTMGSLLVRGQFQWTGLVPVTDGRVLRDKGANATPIWDTISNILDTIGNTRGGLLYRGAGGWAVLSPSAAGKVLTDGGAGADPSWQTSSGGGSPASSFWLDGTDGFVGLVDSNGLLVTDSQGRGVYSKDPTLPAKMITGVTGTTDGSSAPAGQVGELIKQVVPFASGVALTSGTAANAASITLTPGCWDVSGSCFMFPNGASATTFNTAISLVSNTLPSPTVDADGFAELSTAFTVSAASGFNIAPHEVNVTVNTVVYLVAAVTYTGGSVTAWGTIRARRVR